MTPAGFPKQAHVRARAEFDRVFQQGRRTASPMMALHRLVDEGPVRLGLAVSRKVDPTAVGRNRIKRVIRDQFRRMRSDLAPGAYVLVARPAARQADNDALRDGFLRLLQRAGALPVATPAGTMSADSSSPLPPDAPASTGP
ncbi:ribonuclease P protein component [Luteimonas yindakuii]|uniref:ribonuclease P protein component n=1 Tax=Luteimonas yindakuii TaxID=2565782 RepID=UPI0010A3968B|nr:ribonuclease P protein component [Luteimonas yindakuii]QCO66637.1 ribonuclease P protein component [Luteimonas yindakuii]